TAKVRIAIGTASAIVPVIVVVAIVVVVAVLIRPVEHSVLIVPAVLSSRGMIVPILIVPATLLRLLFALTAKFALSLALVVTLSLILIIPPRILCLGRSARHHADA